ncbi:MAG: hypothetical protein AM1032_000352 [Mycoplasmataceae bacterium]|nr:MAG: hypothetical protein AM1032_000352 [Mycoplasmataceae bacterium]
MWSLLPLWQSAKLSSKELVELVRDVNATPEVILERKTIAAWLNNQNLPEWERNYLLALDYQADSLHSLEELQNLARKDEDSLQKNLWNNSLQNYSDK